MVIILNKSYFGKRQLDISAPLIIIHTSPLLKHTFIISLVTLCGSTSQIQSRPISTFYVFHTIQARNSHSSTSRGNILREIERRCVVVCVRACVCVCVCMCVYLRSCNMCRVCISRAKQEVIHTSSLFLVSYLPVVVDNSLAKNHANKYIDIFTFVDQ